MSAELARVHDAEIAQPGDALWEEAKSEWAMGAEIALKGQLRQARAAHMVERRHGDASLEDFGKDVGASRSKVYSYSTAWSRLLAHFGSADAVSARLDDSPLTITNVIEAAKEEDIPRALDEAEDGNLSSRQQRAKRREKSEPVNVEMVHMLGCPECGAAFRMKDAKSWEEAAM